MHIFKQELRKSTLRNTYTQNSKVKSDQQKVEIKNNSFTLKMHYFLQ